MNSEFGDILARLETLMAERKTADPTTSYVAKLYGRGREKIAQKLGEEAVETVIAAVTDKRTEMVSESADLIFHWLVLLADAGISLDEVAAELARREGLSGIDEKTARKGN
jgi:phosphoribosyl-ATP pyrophosphohydrolase